MPVYSDLMRFKNRNEAGDLLGNAVAELHLGEAVVVLGLPRGGVPVAARVAERCNAPLDILVVRKIGTPGHEELAAGAIASGGIVVWNEGVLSSRRLTASDLAEVVEAEEDEVRKRERAIRTSQTPALELRDKKVVIVDDGVATGATVRAAIRAVHQCSPAQVVVALPVGPDDTCEDLKLTEGCTVVCLSRVDSSEFGSVGSWYDDFSQVETWECRDILKENRQRATAKAPTTAPPASHDLFPRQP